MPMSRQTRVGRRLKLRDLDILSKVVQWGSMAKAASPLGMSQPAVSEAVAGLEGALGVRLLDRSPQGVTPTIYARALLRRADIAFDELQQGMRDIEFLATLTIGEGAHRVSGITFSRLRCRQSSSLTRRYPMVSVDVVAAQPGNRNSANCASAASIS